MMNTLSILHDIDDFPLHNLVNELIALRSDVISQANIRLKSFSQFYPDQKINNSAYNLAHYLCLRQHDLRILQDKLAQIGLSSLGRLEAHVVASINSVIDLL